LILADDPVSDEEIRKRAREKHRWRTFEREGEPWHRSRKIGFDDGEWCWQLPDYKAPVDPDDELLGMTRLITRRESAVR
jgi:hypothetical protein